MGKKAILIIFLFLLPPTISGANVHSTYSSNKSNNIDYKNLAVNNSTPGYYKVIDVLPSGKKIVRGIFPLNEESTPRPKPKGYDQPFSSEYVWFPGQTSALLYLGSFIDHGNPRLTDKNTALLTFNGTCISANNSWNLILGTADYGATIDYNNDSYDDYIVPSLNNVPILLDHFTGKEVHNFYISNGVTGNVLSVKTGNLDDDYQYEVVFLIDDNGAKLKILDNAANDFSELKTIDLLDYLKNYTDSGNIIYSQLASLYLYDIDNDGRDEILVSIPYRYQVYNSYYAKGIGLIFDDKDSDFSLLVQFKTPIPIEKTNYDSIEPKPEIVAGDFDGDGNYEIILSYWTIGYFEYRIDSHTVELINDMKNSNYYPTLATLFYDPKISVVDLNFDHRDELVVASTMSGSYITAVLMFNSTTVTKIIKILTHTETYSEPVGINMITGDFDNDVFPEIMVAVYTSRYKEIFVYDDATKDYQKKAEKLLINKDNLVSVTMIPVSLNGRVLVRYTGHHNLSMPNPYIIAVAAAPPTIKGILQNHGDSATMFGTAVTRSTSETNGYTINVASTISFNEGLNMFKVINIQASVTISKEFQKTHTTTSTIEECREFTTDFSSDYVIFESVTYDNYYYEIVLHPIKKYIGQIMAISIPNKVAVYKWTIDYFNSHNGNAPDIGSETFNHTVGEVWTYPTKDEMEKLESLYNKTGFWKTSSALPVGAGEGINSLEIDLSHEETSEYSTSFGVEFELGFDIMGIGLSQTFGIASDYAYEVTVGNSTTYRGDVGDIAPSYYETYHYSFGLFVYNFHRKDAKQAYQIINYWIEDYNGPREQPNNLYSIVSGNPTLVNTIDKLSYTTNLDPNITTALLLIALPITVTSITTYAILKRKNKKKKKGRKRKKRK